MAQRLDFEYYIEDDWDGEGTKELNLFDKGGVTIGDADIASIVDFLIAHTEIQLLTLLDNEITAKGVKVLMKDIQKTNITRLGLNANPIGDDGVTAIAKTFPNTKLKEIGLQNVNMTDIGVKALLEGIQYNASIQDIWIGNFSDLFGNKYENKDAAMAYGSQIDALLTDDAREKRSKVLRATTIFKWVSQNVDSFTMAEDSVFA